jgi:hypothetical protein
MKKHLFQVKMFFKEKASPFRRGFFYEVEIGVGKALLHTDNQNNILDVQFSTG